MAISLKRYVDITSSVGAGINVGERQLIGRFFDDNSLIPTNSQIDFDTFDDVSSYFGSGSLEAARAAFYFGWISKNGTAPQKMSFVRWNSVASAPQIYGAKQAQPLAAWTIVTSGSFGLTIGGVANTFTALNFSGAANLAAVATIIQTAVRAKTGAQWTGATVAFDPTSGKFTFTGGTVGAATISVQAGTGGGDIAGQLGWLSPTAIISAGGAVQSITDVLSQSANVDNNFGSFTFTAALTQSQIVEAATWNDTQNNMFMYSVGCDATTIAAISAACIGLSGVTFTLSPVVSPVEYPEQEPMMILAATDYTAPIDTTQNYMFQIFDLTPSVYTDTDADTYDALRVNYYGQTQTAGQLLSFYQRGYMMGLPSDALDQNTYANEIWLKDAMGAAIMTLLLALSKISANAAGRAQILNILQGVIQQGLTNGTISVGKALTDVQKLYITQNTGDPLAWKQVENLGYWVDVQIVEVVENGSSEYKAVYTLIYSKDDIIRKVEGLDILI